jgi:hypothetical protein
MSDRRLREGMRFALPLLDGRSCRGMIDRANHRVVDVRIYTPDGAALLLQARVRDRALAEGRWPIEPGREVLQPLDAAGPVLEPGVVERMVLAALHGQPLSMASFVREMHGAFDAAALAPLPDGVRINLRRRLESAQIDALAAWSHDRPRASFGIFGSAREQLGEIVERVQPSRLVLDARDGNGLAHPSCGVRVLDWNGALPTTGFAAFPDLRVMHVDARGARIKRDLALPEALDVLDLRNARIDDLAALLAPHVNLRVLRLARIEGCTSLEPLRALAHLQALYLEHLVALDGLEPLLAMHALRSLDLRGAWQFTIDDLAEVVALPSLRALRVDIGGRRKNVELYRRRVLAEPLPYRAYDDLTTMNACRVQSMPAWLSSVTTNGVADLSGSVNGGV